MAGLFRARRDGDDGESRLDAHAGTGRRNQRRRPRLEARPASGRDPARQAGRPAGAERESADRHPEHAADPFRLDRRTPTGAGKLELGNTKGECEMNRRFLAAALTAWLGCVILQAQGQTPRPNADPYANNPDAGKTQFPLAAPAGKDSGAITNAPAGAVNQGILDLAKWKDRPTLARPPD